MILDVKRTAIITGAQRSGNMTIDKAIDRLEDLHFEQDNWEYGELTEDCLLNREALRLAIDTMRKYQKLQADYENRLKADMADLLTDFLMDIEENTSINSDDSHERNGKRLMRTEIIGMFEQKINSLEEK